MSFEIPEFSDDLAHCDPCGWPNADTAYVPAIVGIASLDRIINPFGGRWPVFAFLKRTCTRCGFQWAEAPLPRQQAASELCDFTFVNGDPCNLHVGHLSPHTSPHRTTPRDS